MSQVTVISISTDDLRQMISDAVAEAISRTAPPQEAQKYFTVTQLSELLNWKLTTVYQNHSNGLIPGAVKVGNRLLFDTGKVLTWIAENGIPTKAEKVAAYERRRK